MALELGSLKKAVASLDRAWKFSQKRLKNQAIEPEEAELLKAGVVQIFEFTYELCWKFMKRWLEINLTPGMMEGISRKQLFRFAIENRLIDDYDKWVLYHELRNKTSHIYDQAVAASIFEQAGNFLEDAKAFLVAFEARND